MAKLNYEGTNICQNTHLKMQVSGSGNETHLGYYKRKYCIRYTFRHATRSPRTVCCQPQMYNLL